jgi:hypothetical protein
MKEQDLEYLRNRQDLNALSKEGARRGAVHRFQAMIIVQSGQCLAILCIEPCCLALGRCFFGQPVRPENVSNIRQGADS